MGGCVFKVLSDRDRSSLLIVRFVCASIEFVYLKSCLSIASPDYRFTPLFIFCCTVTWLIDVAIFVTTTISVKELLHVQG